MKSLFITICLILSATFAQANTDCSMKIQGVDTWPWKVAQPWKNIQGIWKLSTDDGDIYFKFRITGNMNKDKILLIDKIVDGNCAAPVARGVGYIATKEKNVIRTIISEGKVRYQLKLAVFDTEDLSSSLLTDVNSCGQQVIGISVLEVIGQGGKKYSVQYSGTDEPAENMLLKKVSNSLDSICKKPTGH